MSQPPEPTLQKRIDDFSYQVASSADARFWFRLERTYDRDIITEYFLGSFPRERSAALLEDGYRVLGLSPSRTLVFRDIVPTMGPARCDQALDDARDLYLTAGSALLMGSGALRVSGRLESDLGKYHLILVGQ
jgi:hypothetical protein